MADKIIDNARRLIVAGYYPDKLANALGVSKTQAGWIYENLKAEIRRTRVPSLKAQGSNPSIFHTCQFLTDPKLRDFCGAPTHKHTSWCKEHFDLCCQ